VFGPFAQFPLTAERPYDPLERPAESYLAMLDRVGIARGVLVQPVAHGLDCGALLHALASHPARLRGIALLTTDVTDAELKRMDLLGIRGARFSQPPPGLTQGSVGFDVLERLAPRLASLGWHAQIWAPCDALEALVERLSRLGLPLVVDHMGGIDVKQGTNARGFQSLLRLLEAGKIWLKLIPYRLSNRYPDYEDVMPFHQALVAANPDRLIWGTDSPHVVPPNIPHDTPMPDAAQLLDLLDRWTADKALQERILVSNPEQLYRF
jgi:predicted TIM-barrel fold metal-dependent hydrolase